MDQAKAMDQAYIESTWIASQAQSKHLKKRIGYRIASGFKWVGPNHREANFN